MEFNFLGDDLKAPPFQLPLPIQSLFSGPTLLPQGGFPSVFPVVPYNEEIMNPNGRAGAGEDVLRKMERERIRLEIISSEITRKLMLEREMALQRSLGGRSLLDEQVATGLSSNHRPNLTLPPYDNPNPIPDHPKPNKNKLIMLEKPNPDIYREKRKAVTQDVDDGGHGTEHAPVAVKKKPKDKWSCELCSVTVTSERALDEHFQGKKHKARDFAQKKMQKIRMSTSASPSLASSTLKNSEQSLKPTEAIVAAAATEASDMEAKADAPQVTKLDTDQKVVVGKAAEEVKSEDEDIVEKVQITQDSGKKHGTETEQQVRATPNYAVNKKGFKFWCELCNVGSSSLAVMENHRRGKKHTNRLKRLKDGESAPLFTKDASPAT